MVWFDSKALSQSPPLGLNIHSARRTAKCKKSKEDERKRMTKSRFFLCFFVSVAMKQRKGEESFPKPQIDRRTRNWVKSSRTFDKR
jgi:hypothetical protein